MLKLCNCLVYSVFGILLFHMRTWSREESTAKSIQWCIATSGGPICEWQREELGAASVVYRCDDNEEADEMRQQGSA